MIEIKHSFDEDSATLEIIGDEPNNYLIKFFYFSTLIYETTLSTNTWSKTSAKCDCIKVFDEDKNLIFNEIDDYTSNQLFRQQWKKNQKIWVNGDIYDCPDFYSNINFIQTTEKDYSTVHIRSLINDGCIVDIGCLTWDWSSYFINKKRVIGVDPFENEIKGAEIFKGIIGPFNGKTVISDAGFGSSVFSDNNENAIEFEVLSWKSFCKYYNIDKISILKINIEGSEYPLLNSLDIDDYKKIDQIVISFHDWINPKWIELTKSTIQLLLNNGFEIMKINQEFNWYLALNKNTKQTNIR